MRPMFSWHMESAVILEKLWATGLTTFANMATISVTLKVRHYFIALRLCVNIDCRPRLAILET